MLFRSHTLEVLALDAAGDSRRRAAWRLMARGGEANLAGGDAGAAAAIDAYEDAAEIWAGLGATSERTYALFAVAMIEYWHTKNRERSAELAARAAEVYEMINEPALWADATYLHAASLIEIAEESAEPQAVFDEALGLFERAASTYARIGKVYEQALTINNIGLTHFNKGDWAAARRFWEMAAPMFRDLDEWSGELLPLANVAVIDAEEGYLRNAQATLQRVLEIFPPGKNLSHQVDTYANLGGVERLLGNFDEALRGFSRALEIATEIEDVYGQGWALYGVGQTYLSMGDLELAQKYLEDALPKEQAAGDLRGEAAVLRYLGIIQQSRGDYGAALIHHTEALARATSPPDRALVLLLLAEDLMESSRHEEAIARANEALRIAEDSNSQFLAADALEQRGRVHLSAGQLDMAREDLERSLALYQELQIPSGLARTEHGLALAARARGDLQIGRAHV